MRKATKLSMGSAECKESSLNAVEPSPDTGKAAALFCTQHIICSYAGKLLGKKTSRLVLSTEDSSCNDRIGGSGCLHFPPVVYIIKNDLIEIDIINQCQTQFS